MSMTESERLTRREEDDLFSVYLRKALIERLADYEDIGTVSEFRELKEKATAYKYCPTCNAFVCDTRNESSCDDCQIFIDWRNGNG